MIGERVNQSYLKKLEEEYKMKFDYVIGNPPYQETSDNTSDKPVYNEFMDSAYKVADKVELITPARFLFNAGKTSKAWNEKMLNSKHFKVLEFQQDSSKVFSNTDIKGGIAITYFDSLSENKPIEVFSAYSELNSILTKVKAHNYDSFSELIFAPESYKFVSLLYDEHPEIKTMVIKNRRGEDVPLISKGHDYDLTTNIFDKLYNIIFFMDKPTSDEDYIQVIGRMNNERVNMWVKRKYINNHQNLNKWKVIVPKSNGTGAIGEGLSTPLIGEPLIGHTQTFISIGAFDTKFEANNCIKYVKSKFARTMLGILKVTQDNKKSTWKYVPMQNFTETSDIDWTQSISDVDKQLYKKYGLSQEEIDFIETHVKEMK